MAAAAKILIVDDEIDILEFISYNLEKEGYKTITANDGLEAIRIAREENPDLIIMDVMMPRLDGFDATEHIRNFPTTANTLIAFLTAKTDELSELKAFAAGADDYIHKPIKPKLLMSRVNALLRRKNLVTKHEIIKAGKITIDSERHSVKVEENEIVFARKEFLLLSLLASKPGKVFLRHHILKDIWGDQIIVGDRTIDVHIRKIREKIGEDYIKTIKGVGYKFES